MPGGLAIINAEFIAKTIAFIAIAAFGWQLRRNATAKVILPAAVGSSLFFYFVTNTASWIFEPLYAKSAAGWVQAVTTGLPGFAPSWMFYRNAFVSDMVFTVLFLACVARGAARQAEPVAVRG